MLDTQSSPFDFLQTYQEIFQTRQEIENINTSNINSYLAFKVGNKFYLLSMEQVFEVANNINDITPLPFTPKWLLGLTSHRTDIYSVIDFNKFLSTKQGAGSSNIKTLTNYILLRNDGQGYILKVDEVYGIRTCEVTGLESQFAWLDGCVMMEERNWLRINIKDLMSDPLFSQNMQ